MKDFDLARLNMVESQVRCSDVNDPRIVNAMRRLPREQFVPKSREDLAYMDECVLLKDAEDGAPARYMMDAGTLGKLLQATEIEPGDVVLIVGCGTGYSAAVASSLGSAVVALECDEELAAKATDVLTGLDLDNVAVVSGPLADGLAKQGPYDAIILDGRVDEVSEALFDQLKEGGRLAAVVTDGPIGKATVWTKHEGNVSGRIEFDATIQPLPGFEREEAFAF